MVSSSKKVSYKKGSMTNIDILAKLEARRRKGAEVQKSMVSKIQHQASLRRAMDRETMRGERARIEGVLARGSLPNPRLMRDRWEELSKQLASRDYSLIQ